MYNARNQYIDNAISNFDIAKDNSRGHMSEEYNNQMKFWKQLVAGAMADNDMDLLSRAQEAIKGVKMKGKCYKLHIVFSKLTDLDQKMIHFYAEKHVF